jgi:caffeoyl-CoA O-methyltransferase
MGMRYIEMNDALFEYVTSHANPAHDEVAAQLAATTQERFASLAGMNIGVDQGRFLMTLVAVTGATTVVEVGTFTGMSALWMARGLRPGGKLTCFDITDRYLATAREAWRAAGVDDRIDVRIGPASEGLTALPDEPHVDLAFVDADKTGYATYLELLLPRLTERGLIVVDNVLWSGTVVDDTVHDDDTRALRAFNDDVATRDDVEAVMLPVGDGITLIRRRHRA